MAEYFRFEPEGLLGLVCSGSAASIFAGSDEKMVACPALENVHFFNMKTGDLMHVLSETGNKHTVTALAQSESGAWAVGYEDGSVRIFGKVVEFASQPSVVFSGHRSGVCSLVFSQDSGLLASASRDGDIVVWDIQAECGRHRLAGHQGPVNALLMPTPDTLLSAGKDMMVRVWDLPSQHCVETCVQHHGEITGMQLCNGILITVGAEKMIRFFRVNIDLVPKLLLKDCSSAVLELIRSTDRYSKERVVSMHIRHGHVALALSDRLIELYRLSGEGTAKFLRAVKLPHKARSVSISKRKPADSIRLLIAYQSRNLVEEIEFPFDGAQALKVVNSPLARLGHRSDIRVVCKGGSYLVSASQDIVRVWDSQSKELIASLEPSAEPISGIIVGELLVLGLKSGSIEVWKLHNGELVKCLEEVHGGCVWSLHLGPDGKTIASASADKTVKFFEIKADHRLKHIKTLQMDEECLAVSISPDNRFISVALLDMTIKVFHRDSLRFHLSLYGHKLPAVCLAYTADSQRLLSAGPDKSLRVWSLQFGDCRRTVHAHSEAVTALQLIPGTAAQFWTASRAGDLRRWDADGANGLQRIQAIEAHHGEVLAIAVGEHSIVSVGKDQAIRLHAQGDDPLFPQEEEENEHDRMIDQGLVETAEKATAELDKTSTATVRAMKAGERLLEAIECADTQRLKEEAYLAAKATGLPAEEPTREPLFLAAGGSKTPAQLVLWACAMIPLADLEEALLTLPECRLPSLLRYAEEWIELGLAVGDDALVIASRVLNNLMRAHWRLLFNHPEWRLESLVSKYQAVLSQWRQLIGLNKISLSYSISN